MADRPKRQRTSTSNFGVGKRENHDESGFYERFRAPELSSDDTVIDAGDMGQIFVHDARDMAEVPDSSVALVVTSPPYFAGKAYEEALGEGAIPADYQAYLQMLEDVFRECERVLEPGGRIAVNVANLGRKPFRSLASDVTWILQDRLGMLLRGEVIWQKARGAGGNCAWGSFQSATNPVLRDLTERVVVASKGRFERARPVAKRAKEGLPHQSTIGKDRFLDLTVDWWEFPPESASRVGHPAPFPVELPRRFIELYTFEGDLVLDPFMGSGSTGVAAVQLGRRWVGFDTDAAYAQAARDRIADAEDAVRFDEKRREQTLLPPLAAEITRARREGGERALGYQQRATAEGTRAQELAELLLQHCGFLDRLTPKQKLFDTGVEANFVGVDDDGNEWIFDVSGAFTSSRPGLERTDTLWKALGKAAVVRPFLVSKGRQSRYVLLTTDVPKRGTAGYRALKAAFDDQLIWDVLLLDRPETIAELLHYASGERAEPEGRREHPTAYA